jgi:hypothetical protein
MTRGGGLHYLEQGEYQTRPCSNLLKLYANDARFLVARAWPDDSLTIGAGVLTRSARN